MNINGESYPTLTINLSKFLYGVNVTSALILLTIGGSLMLSKHGMLRSPNIIGIVNGDVGTCLALLAVIDILVNTVYAVTVSWKIVACIYFEMCLMICSIIVKAIALNNPEKVAPLFVEESVFIKDFSYEDIKFDLNNNILYPRESLAQSWAFVQMKLLCCGLSGPNDYTFLKTHQRQGIKPLIDVFKTPLSCCLFDRLIPGIGIERDLLEECRANEQRVHRKGCFGDIWRSTGTIYEMTRILLIILVVTEIGQLDALWRTLRWHSYELGNYLP